MAPIRRLTLVLVALASLLALSAVPVAAGGSATADVTAGLDEPPIAGEDREVRVLLLQHGVTPVDFGRVAMTATLPSSGETVTTEATSVGDGSWAATIVFPSAGQWQLRVTHNDLETPAAMAVAVADAGPSLPPLAAPIAAIAGLLLVALLVMVVVRRSRPTAPSATPAEAPLPRG
jgi:hypothetical protein